MHVPVPPTSPGHTYTLNMLAHMYSHRHAYTLTCSLKHTHIHAGTHWQYILSHTYTRSHHHQDCPLFRLCPLRRRTKGYQWLGGRNRAPYPFAMPTALAQGSSHSPAWSGCHGGRGLPPEPPCGRRTSRRHSLLQEKNREEAMGRFWGGRTTGVGPGDPGCPLDG